MRVAILSSESPENACARLRLRDVLKHLQPEVSFTWTGIKDAALLTADFAAMYKSADAIVVQRSFPRPSTMETLQAVLFESGKPVIYETDDLLTDLPHTHPEFSTYAKYRHLTLSCIANCDAIIVSAAALKNRYAPLNPRAYVFSNTLDKSLWYQPMPQRQAAGAGRQLTIGFCGSHTHVPDLEGIEAALERIQENYRERVRFSFFGCITKRLKQLPGMSYREGFVSYSDYPALLRSLQFDIGLAPLVNNPFNTNKSHIKYLEYAACGIPGVYSDIAPYNASVTHGRTGMLTEHSADAWYGAISRLIEQPELANSIAATAYEDVWNRFATETNALDWRMMVEEIIANFQTDASGSSWNRPPLAKAMWEQSVDYERRMAANEEKLKLAWQQLEWLEQHPMARALRAATGLLKKWGYGRN